ncbi:nucleotide sugar dehydrogenase [Iamia sp.]|uniref:nucleotide sugar dehydrogenase n=1 Tax=Iamia sp. TaxID=2722710 RepID=UPI002CAC9C7B|nr:nucleotide sugar dehydrogenase [Iamia sp.]HXH57684.1 nucleotide sugar dehydrogenase [Iamia sp.]
MSKVVVIGQGYVGLPVAVRASEAGFEVIGFDVATERVGRLAAGESFIEDITDVRLRAALSSGRYRPSADPGDLAGFDVAVISVPTPLRDGVPDLSYIESAAAGLAPHMTTGCTVVLESTTYPGSTEELVAPVLEQTSGLTAGVDFHLGYSPERIDPGNETWTFERTPKIVSGVSPASLVAVQGFFDQLVDKTIPVSTPKEAELAKLLENTFRHVNIALVNELAMFANDLGINVWEAIEAADSKPFGFMKFPPGPGVGGHCLPIDPSYLSWRVRRSLGHTFRFVELANDVNEHMPDYVVQRVVAALNQRSLAVRGQGILVLGLSYKKNTGDPREAPSKEIVKRLLALGAEVRVVDPHVVAEQVPAGVIMAQLSADELAAAELAILVVDHDAFDRQLIVDSGTHVLDCRNVLTGPTVEQL